MLSEITVSLPHPLPSHLSNRAYLLSLNEYLTFLSYKDNGRKEVEGEGSKYRQWQEDGSCGTRVAAYPQYVTFYGSRIGDPGAMKMERLEKGSEKEEVPIRFSSHEGGLGKKSDSGMEASRPGGTNGNNKYIL